MSDSKDLHLSRENAKIHRSLSDVPKAHNQANRFEHGINHSLPKRAPLRCIQDNPNLLRSPGPLESMLKTTTETGDIGVFTIKPTIAPASYHQPPRPRTRLADANLLQASRSRYNREISNRDDRRRLPSSYRDTTSEILSLYGSDTHHSRAFTPSDDDERRSYSLTTCSSRHMPSHKSSMTLQSQASGPGLQRPRSPFPYPTRLRRPGFRAASPALTENGEIDYSRMVHLDRPTQRTIHGSYRPTYRHIPRSALPSLRVDTNRSTASLPCRSSPSTYTMGSPTLPARVPMDRRFGTPSRLERPREDSNTQSLRSSSLTSIVEMYQGSSTAYYPEPPQQSSGAFYYDYSEEFEDRNPSYPPLTHTTVPVCPIPQRAVSLSRPMVLRAEEDGYIEMQAAQAVSARSMENGSKLQSNMGKNRSRAHTFAHGHEPSTILPRKFQYDSCHDHDNQSSSDPSIDDRIQTEKSKFTENGIGVPPEPLRLSNSNRDEPDHPRLIGEQKQPEPTPPESRTVNVIPPSPRHSSHSLADADHQKPDNVLKRCRGSKTNSSEEISSLAQPDLMPGVLAKQAKYSFDPEPTDPAPVFASFNQPSRSPLSNDPEEGLQAEGNSPEEGVPQLAKAPSKPTADSQKLASIVSERCDNGLNGFRKGHRRNLAATSISPLSLNGVSEPLTEPVASLTREKTLSPQLESSHCNTGARKGIASLLKAMPPLPTTELGEFSPSYSIGGPSETPRQEDSDYKVQEQNKSKLGDPPGDEAEPNLPKFRVRLKQSVTLNTSSESEPMSASDLEQSPSHEDSTNHFQRKLKIKIAKAPRALQVHAGLNGTVLRSPALKQCNSLADLEHCIRRDMFTSRSQLENAFREGDVEHIKESSNTYQSRADQASELPADHPDSNMPVALVTKNDSESRSQPSSRPGLLRHARSLGSDMGQSSQGLRQKLSFLRLRIGGTQQGKELKEEGDILPACIQEDLKEDTMSSKGLTQSPQSGICEKQPDPPHRSTKKLLKRWTRGVRQLGLHRMFARSGRS